MGDFMNFLETKGLLLALSGFETAQHEAWKCSLNYFSFFLKRAFSFGQMQPTDELFFIFGHFYEVLTKQVFIYFFFIKKMNFY